MVCDLFGVLEEEGRVRMLTGGDRDVKGLTVDSRKVRTGWLFAALPGPHRDGHTFLSSAVEAGASTLLIERGRWPRGGVVGAPAVIETRDVREVLGEVSARFFEHPSREMDVFGVTGTNGKTSVTYLLESIFGVAGLSSGVIGTVEHRWGGGMAKATSTTPEAVELQDLLRRMADDGVRAVAMEVSSHALAQHRVRGCTFRAAIFTNLGRDHLDFHPDLEDYFASKAGLFRDFLPAVAVINGDDPWGERLLGWMPGAVSYGLGEGAVYTALNVSVTAGGICFDLRGADREFPVRSPLLGTHNVYNILASAAAACEYGIPSDAVRRGIESVRSIPGRFEKVSEDGDPAVLIDYAHTPDALEKALLAARELTEDRLILVFGCGGDRDRGKRPLMGRVAAEGADLTFMTSDNPRTEDPMDILGQIEKGYRGHARGGRALRVIPDRRRAIREAVAAAGSGDVVLIAGKGHEDYQVLAGGEIPFSDRDETRRALEERKT